MTAHFAIPATTFVLRAILQARIKASYGTYPAPTVSIAPPPRPAPAGGATPGQPAPPEPAGLHLFLHHAGPNTAWRNMHDPRMGPDGARTAPAPLVVDLHYLLAATGADLEREALLGIGMSAFHRNGIVARPMIQSLLGAIAVPGSPTRLMDELTAEPLHDPAGQPEQITIAQASVDLDLSTKIWSALQSPLRPSAHYLVTTVFLDTGETYPAPVPVSTVGLGVKPDTDPATAVAPGDRLTVTEDGG